MILFALHKINKRYVKHINFGRTMYKDAEKTSKKSGVLFSFAIQKQHGYWPKWIPLFPCTLLFVDCLNIFFYFAIICISILLYFVYDYLTCLLY